MTNDAFSASWVSYRTACAHYARCRPDPREIHPLESQMSLKWQEMRLRRAGPVNTEAFATGTRCHYR